MGTIVRQRWLRVEVRMSGDRPLWRGNRKLELGYRVMRNVGILLYIKRVLEFASSIMEEME